MRIVDADEEHDPLYSVEGEVEFDDPRVVVEMTFSIANLTFPAPGEYRIQLSAGGEPMMERRIVIYQVPGPSQ